LSDIKNSNPDKEQELRQRIEILEQLTEEYANTQMLQSALYYIADIVTSTDDMHSFYRTLHDIIGTLTEAKEFYIALYHPEEDAISFPYYEDDEDDQQNEDEPLNNPNEKIPISKMVGSSTVRILKNGKMLHLDKEEQDRSGGLGRSSEDWLGVPLKHDNNILGAIAVQSYKPGFRYDHKDEYLLNYVSQHIAIALQRKKDTESLKKAHRELQDANTELENRSKEVSTANIKLEAMLEERRSIQEKLVYDAFHDALTDLPNRALFTNRLEHVIKRNRRRGEFYYSVFFLDLDRFKVINDSLGHLAGDALLKEVAERLMDCIRPGDTVARLGGDEFFILLDNIKDKIGAIKVADRILEKFKQPVLYKGHEIPTSTSIGITLSSIGYDNPDDILRDADVAMYQAKSKGKGCYQIFDSGMHQQAMTRLQLEEDLRQAITNNELTVHYQPIYDIETNKIISFEALARWQHQSLGFVEPEKFIQIAEETGYINELGAYILQQAINQTSQWHNQLNAKNLHINVNLSGYQIEDGLIDLIKNTIDKSGLPITHLKLEVTETALLTNIEEAKSLLSELENMKIQLVLDDFGTGYSSLGYLHQLPLSALKIDLSFINAIETNSRNLAIVRTIQALASSLDLEVVAEGVETQEQYQVVKNLNIEYGQGFYFGKAVPADEAEKLLATQ
jgi:diguanylate cyclase (GGDEF)-like protein